MSNGILIFAHNNQKIDYVKIACLNALMIQKNMHTTNITLVTDKESLTSTSKELLNKCFEHVLLDSNRHSGKRLYRNIESKNVLLFFKNMDRCNAYNLSPYDETLVLDADYLIMNNSLNNVWNSAEDLLMNKNITPIFEKRDTRVFQRLDDFSIPLYWATAIYFKKSEIAEIFFNIIKNVKDNYLFYKQLYTFTSSLYRNDYSASIAAHMLGGFTENEGGNIKPLPTNSIVTAFENDSIYQISDVNNFVLLIERDDAKNSYILTRIKDTNLHMFNKWTLMENYKELVELYE